MKVECDRKMDVGVPMMVCLCFTIPFCLVSFCVRGKKKVRKRDKSSGRVFGEKDMGVGGFIREKKVMQGRRNELCFGM